MGEALVQAISLQIRVGQIVNPFLSPFLILAEDDATFDAILGRRLLESAGRALE
jgi:hypothetical protein